MGSSCFSIMESFDFFANAEYFSVMVS
jgi:hypothetical protein